MTVRINKPALNLREELTKAQGVVRYEQRQFWMDGLVENGTFDSDTSGWSALDSAVLSVDSGNLRVTNVGNNYGKVSQVVPTVAGKTYVVTIDYVGGTSGNTNLRVGSTLAALNLVPNEPISGNVGTSSFSFTAVSTTSYLTVVNDGVDGNYSDVDNVAVFEVDENDNVIHSVPLGFKPVHVYEDGLLQREGDSYDYTVIDTGFEYQIKPTVTPSATTETCVIAEREL